MKEELFTVTGTKINGCEWLINYYGGDFDCSYEQLASLVIPDNAVFEGGFSCSNNQLTSLVIPENTVFEGGFDCSCNQLASIVIPENAVFEGGFDCSCNQLTSLVIPEKAVFGGNFDCSCNQLTSLVIPDNAVFECGFSCSNNQLTSLVIPENTVFGGNFYCIYNNLVSIVPEKAVSEGIFDCSCNHLTELVIAENTVFGGGFYCAYNQLTSPVIPEQHIFTQGEHGKNWVYADGILSHYDTTKRINNLTVYTGKVYTVVIDDNNVAAHGKNIRTAIMNYNFKVSNRDTTDYEKYTINSIISSDLAYEMYRTITGACDIGTNAFIHEVFKDGIPDTIKISDIINMTEGRFGHKQFMEFWK